ncbi:ESX-1 secretion-associated protein [soil metagenome]
MNDRIVIEPAKLREAAREHADVAEYLRTMPATHGAIQESLESLGPIFGELREAALELLEQRRLCYEQQADEHTEVAHNLQRSATMWEEHEADSAQKMRALIEEDS